MLTTDGISANADIKKVTPSDESFSKGALAVIECFQEIPCDPCVKACKLGAINIPGDINALPVLDTELCNGCGLCISMCPGLAIFVVDKTYSDKLALVKLPYEYVPVPIAGQYVTGLNRAGESVGSFEVINVKSGSGKNMTYTVSLAVPQDLAMEVRDIQIRQGDGSSVLSFESVQSHRQNSPSDKTDEPSPCPPCPETIICRCEDITREEILACISDGCKTIDEIKRFTRAGMGACQGRTCRSLIMNELSRFYGKPLEEIPMPTFRPPVKPISLGKLADAFNENCTCGDGK